MRPLCQARHLQANYRNARRTSSLHQVAQTCASTSQAYSDSVTVHGHESKAATSVEWTDIAKHVATLGFHARRAATNSRNDAGAIAGEVYSEIWE